MKAWRFILTPILLLVLSSVSVAATHEIDCINGETNKSINEYIVIDSLMKCRIKSTNNSGQVSYEAPVTFQYQVGGGGRFYGTARRHSGWVSLHASKLGNLTLKVVFAGSWREKTILVKNNDPDSIIVRGVPGLINIDNTNTVNFSVTGRYGRTSEDISSKVTYSIQAKGLESLFSMNNGVLKIEEFQGDNIYVHIKISMGGKSINKRIFVKGSTQNKGFPIIKSGGIFGGDRAPQMGKVFLKMPKSGNDSIIFLSYYKNTDSQKFKYFDMKVNVNGSWKPYVYRSNYWRGGYKELYIDARHSLPYEMMLASIPRKQPGKTPPSLGVFVDKNNYSSVKKIIKGSNLSITSQPPSNTVFGYACPIEGKDLYPAGYYCAKKIDLVNERRYNMKDRVGMMHAYDEDIVRFTLAEETDIRLLLEDGRAYCTIYDAGTSEKEKSFHIRYAQSNECDALYHLKAGEYILAVTPYNTERQYYDSDYRVEIKRGDNYYDSLNWQTYITSKIHKRYRVGNHKKDTAKLADSPTDTVSSPANSTSTKTVYIATENKWISGKGLNLNGRKDWLFEQVAGTNYYRIKDKNNSGEALHIENGKLEGSAIEDGWWSAQWVLVDAGDGYYRIQNRWKPELYIRLHNSGNVSATTIKSHWTSINWKFSEQPISNVKISSVGVSPKSAVVHSTFTFRATLSSDLPTDNKLYYQLKHGGSWLKKQLVPCSGTNCSTKRKITSAASDRKVRFAIFNGTEQITDWKSSSYHSIAKNKAPTLKGNNTYVFLENGVKKLRFSSTWSDAEGNEICNVQVRYRKNDALYDWEETSERATPLGNGDFELTIPFTLEPQTGEFIVQYKGSDVSSPCKSVFTTASDTLNTTDWLDAGSFTISNQLASEYPRTILLEKKSESEYATSLNPFYTDRKQKLEGQCTWYAFGRVKELADQGYLSLQTADQLHKAFEKAGGRHAKFWTEKVAEGHWIKATNTSPLSLEKRNPGMLVVWKSGEHGHVAFVESVSDDKKHFRVSEFNHNWKTNPKKYKDSRFISYESVGEAYFLDVTGGASWLLPAVTKPGNTDVNDNHTFLPELSEIKDKLSEISKNLEGVLETASINGLLHQSNIDLISKVNNTSYPLDPRSYDKDGKPTIDGLGIKKQTRSGVFSVIGKDNKPVEVKYITHVQYFEATKSYDSQINYPAEVWVEYETPHQLKGTFTQGRYTSFKYEVSNYYQKEEVKFYLENALRNIMYLATNPDNSDSYKLLKLLHKGSSYVALPFELHSGKPNIAYIIKLRTEINRSVKRRASELKAHLENSGRTIPGDAEAITKGISDGATEAALDYANGIIEDLSEIDDFIGAIFSVTYEAITDPVNAYDRVHNGARRLSAEVKILVAEVDEIVKGIIASVSSWDDYKKAKTISYFTTLATIEIFDPAGKVTKVLKINKGIRPKWVNEAYVLVKMNIRGFPLPSSTHDYIKKNSPDSFDDIYSIAKKKRENEQGYDRKNNPYSIDDEELLEYVSTGCRLNKYSFKSPESSVASYGEYLLVFLSKLLLIETSHATLNLNNCTPSEREEIFRSLARGKKFDKAMKAKYPINQVYVCKDITAYNPVTKRCDLNGQKSEYYILDAMKKEDSVWKIISHKSHCFDASSIKKAKNSARRFMNEMRSKYPPGMKIAGVPSNTDKLKTFKDPNIKVGGELEGSLVLEVPMQGANWDSSQLKSELESLGNSMRPRVKIRTINAPKNCPF